MNKGKQSARASEISDKQSENDEGRDEVAPLESRTSNHIQKMKGLR
jgi:hypothetical protein